MAGMTMEDMLGCPHGTPAMPNRPKGRPLIALFLAKVASGSPTGGSLPVRAAVVEGPTWAGKRVLR